MDLATEYDNQVIFNESGNGEFALVVGGEKRVISNARQGLGALMAIVRGSKGKAVPKAVWDGIPSGKEF